MKDANAFAGQPRPEHVEQLMTALVVLVPDADALVAPFRQRSDPVAPLGMPPHVTVLFPFMREGEIGSDVVRRLSDVFSGLAPFEYQFRETGSFPGVLYLKPEPEGPFSGLIAAASALFPALAPCREAQAEPIPHLTVAHADTESELDEIRTDFEVALAAHGPVRGVATEVTLMLHNESAWVRLNGFPLALAEQL